MGCAHCQPRLPVLDWEIQSGSCISTSNKDAASQTSPPFTSVQVPRARPVLKEFEFLPCSQNPTVIFTPKSAALFNMPLIHLL